MSAASALIVLVTWVSYLSAIPRGRVAARPTGSTVLQWLGIGLAVAALVWGFRTGTIGAAVIAPASFALFMGGFFLWLLTQRLTPIGDLKVEVGDELLPFETKTSEGKRFHTDTLAGKRTLLKFFRGGW